MTRRGGKKVPRATAGETPPKRADGPQPPYTARLSEAELVEAVRLFLFRRGDLPPSAVGLFRHRFGMIGNPIIQLFGDGAELPNAGDIYFDWSFEVLPNVEVLPTPDRRRKT